MAGTSDEQVTSPDQRKSVNPKPARVGGIFLILALLSLLIGNHRGNIEDFWIIGLATGIAALLIADWLLRKNGLKP